MELTEKQKRYINQLIGVTEISKAELIEQNSHSMQVYIYNKDANERYYIKLPYHEDVMEMRFRKSCKSKVNI